MTRAPAWEFEVGYPGEFGLGVPSAGTSAEVERDRTAELSHAALGRHTALAPSGRHGRVIRQSRLDDHEFGGSWSESG